MLTLKFYPANLIHATQTSTFFTLSNNGRKPLIIMQIFFVTFLINAGIFFPGWDTVKLH